jgi:subtilisin family serine protease
VQTHNRLPKFTRRGGLAVLAVVAGTLAMPLTAGPAKAAAASGPMTSVIVRGQNAACAPSLDQTLTALGGRMTRTLAILDGGAAVVPAGELAALSASPCVVAVTKDATLSPTSIGSYDPTQDTGSLYNTTLMINAQKAWSKGFTGKGVGVALIDTGVAPVQGLNGPGQVINGPDLSFASQSPSLIYNDEYGHGTHLAGIIAGNDLYGQPAPTGGLLGGLVNTLNSTLNGGNGQTSRYVGDTNHFIGVAPDSHVLNMKVGDENGVVDVSQVIASIDWIVQHKNDPGLNIRVINLSYGTTSGQAYTLDPLAYAAEVAWRNGIVVVTAAGNGGNSSASLNDPAYDPFVLAVGAADTMSTNTYSDDVVASFSNAGDGTRNPDLVAPGVHVESLRDPGSNIDLQYGSTATVGTRFFLGSGTSQAAAVVSGAVALYYSAHPYASPNTVKKALVKSATPLNNQPATLQGAGELNVAAAIGRDVDNSAQKFTPSTGTGTLDAARGGMNVTANGVALTGETDIMGNAWSSASMAQAEASTSAWNGGTFNGAAWSGAGWSGAGWSGAGWSGAAWSGAGWSGAAWSGAAWSGSTWDGAGWSGAGWSGAGWSGAGWSGAGWSGAGWSGAAWSGAAWSGAGWSDYSWS